MPGMTGVDLARSVRRMIGIERAIPAESTACSPAGGIDGARCRRII